jgi:hypothetical protein
MRAKEPAHLVRFGARIMTMDKTTSFREQIEQVGGKREQQDPLNSSAKS